MTLNEFSKQVVFASNQHHPKGFDANFGTHLSLYRTQNGPAELSIGGVTILWGIGNEQVVAGACPRNSRFATGR